MANIASTTIRFYTSNKREITKMFNQFKKIYRESIKEIGAYDFYLHYFTEQEIEEFGCNASGGVDYISDEISTIENTQMPYSNRVGNVYYFDIGCWSKWSPATKLWLKIIEKNFPKVLLAYMGSECGMGLYIKWDESGLFYAPELYDIDVYLEGMAEKKFTTLESSEIENKSALFDYINDAFGFCLDYQDYTIEQLEEKCNEIIQKEDEESYIYIHQYCDSSPYEGE